MSPLPTFDPGFSTADLAAVYSPGRTVAAMLEFEAALALALADAGIAPAGQAEEVAAACRAGVDEADRVLTSTWESGTPIITLRELVTATVETEDARTWFHFGATSQDAIDTGQMIQAKDALEILDRQLTSIARRLEELTIEFRDQPQMGRTFLQDARPTTFGFRTAMWLAATLGHIQDLREQRDGLVVQLGGPVGTLAVYGKTAPKVVSALAGRLGLQTPDVSWHTDRTRVLSLAHSIERAAMSMAKVGSDIALLASSPGAEVRVRSGGSSSMPEKKNPIDSIRAVAAASACAGAVAMLTAAPPHELDRSVGAWHVEWVAVPLVFQSAGAAAEAIGICLDSLEVDRDAMSDNAGSDDQSDLLAAIGPQIDRVLANCDRIFS